MAHAEVGEGIVLNNLENEINRIEGVKRSTDIPPFHGDPELDTIQADVYLERIETAARVGNWNEDRMCREFSLSLRGKAQSWYQSEKRNPRVNLQVWEQVKATFLENYCITLGAVSMSKGFRDLTQGAKETARDFHSRICSAFVNGLRDVPELLIEDIKAEWVGGGAPLHGVAAPVIREVLRTGAERMQNVVMNAIFVSGLRDELRKRVTLLQTPHDLFANLRVAKLEERKMGEEGKTKGTYVCQISENSPTDRITELEKKIAALSGGKDNAVRNELRKKGACFNCGRQGHFSKECRSKKANVNTVQRETAAPTSGWDELFA